MPDPRKIVLIVEDDTDAQDFLAALLQFKGYQAYTVSTGDAAVKAARRLNPSLILMDLRLPGMDGFEATRQIRKLAGFSKTPIIAITALYGEGERALQAGCTEVIPKPVDVESLARVIDWLSLGSSLTGA